MLDFIFHIDQHVELFFSQYGLWAYGLLFIIVFCETGLIITPFLPGDSLLFATGAIAATLGLNVSFIVIMLMIAAILGDTVNYWIGTWAGPKIFKQKKSLLFNPKHLLKAHRFYETYGGKAVIIGRFIPIVRTFVPFVAGMAKMNYKHFILYNISGALLWVGGITYTSYLFGNLPLIKQHFSLVIIGIIIVSLLPPIFEYFRTKQE